MRSPSITACVAWHNHRELEREFWAAVRTEDMEVLVVDNGSDPPLPNAIRLDYNSGFSHATNLALSHVRTDAALLLNNDIFALQPGWLEPIRDALEPGVLVGVCMRYDPHGSVDGMQLPYLDGWCLAGMTDDLRELGGLDESYQEPAYYSDNDLSFRARMAGMTLREVRSPIRHLASQTSGGERGDGVMAAMQANYRRFESLVRESLGAPV